MSVPISDVLRALRSEPAGMTTVQLAAKLGMRRASLNGRLSKSFLWGKGVIDRESRRGVGANGAGYDYFLWRAL